jgi:hypothetical protein
MMSDHLLPPDDLYKKKPAPIEDYKYLNKTGAALFNLADIGLDHVGCPKNYTAAQVEAVLQMLAPTVDAMDKLGLLDMPGRKAYVYGYDEQPISCEHNIRTLFGAVKKRFPKVYTAAVLNWKGGLPADLPVDIWILQYEEYNAKNAQKWRNETGKPQYWYHCIEPSGSGELHNCRPRGYDPLRLCISPLSPLCSDPPPPVHQPT